LTVFTTILSDFCFIFIVHIYLLRWFFRCPFCTAFWGLF